jgi:RHS repeat-associated protein
MGMPLHHLSNSSYAPTVNRHFAFDPGPQLERQYYAVNGLAKSWRFTYDSLGQLKTAADQHWTGQYPGGCFSADWGYECAATQSGWTTDSSRSYSYDLAGNRTSQGGTYGAANRITAANGCTYTTDFDGNVTGRTSCSPSSNNASFTWSAEGQLKTVVAQGKTWTINYDAAGRMVRWLDGAAVNAYFLWDGANLLAELGPTGTTKVAEFSYYPGLDRLHAHIRQDSLFFAQTDGVGNVIALTDAAQTVRRTWIYNDWGLNTGGVDNGNFGGDARVQWKGTLRVGLLGGGGLYYMRNRWYEPRSGRFLSEDPIGLAGGLNKYRYVGNDPVNGADPTGLHGPRGIGTILGVPMSYHKGDGGGGHWGRGADAGVRNDPCAVPGSCQAQGIAVGSGAGTMAGLIVAGACVASTGPVCALGATQIVAMGAAGGAAAGGLVGSVLDAIDVDAVQRDLTQLQKVFVTLATLFSFGQEKQIRPPRENEPLPPPFKIEQPAGGAPPRPKMPCEIFLP